MLVSPCSGAALLYCHQACLILQAHNDWGAYSSAVPESAPAVAPSASRSLRQSRLSKTHSFLGIFEPTNVWGERSANVLVCSLQNILRDLSPTLYSTLCRIMCQVKINYEFTVSIQQLSEQGKYLTVQVKELETNELATALTKKGELARRKC